jgi:hypothetical protein
MINSYTNKISLRKSGMGVGWGSLAIQDEDDTSRADTNDPINILVFFVWIGYNMMLVCTQIHNKAQVVCVVQ